MSQIIAPGQWDAATRKLAKVGGFVIGAMLILGGLRMGYGLIGAVEAGQPVTMWGVALVLVPIGLGGAAVFPGIITPIIYKVIEKVGKDTPE